jgi:hypothetical protein
MRNQRQTRRRPPSNPSPKPPNRRRRPAPPPTFSDQVSAGKLILEVRARYESVDQTKTATLKDDASAFTVRTRLGWETAEFHGVKGLIEFEDVRQVGPEHYAVNVPGATTAPLNGADKARYPIVNDPDVTELNRAATDLDAEHRPASHRRPPAGPARRPALRRQCRLAPGRADVRRAPHRCRLRPVQGDLRLHLPRQPHPGRTARLGQRQPPAERHMVAGRGPAPARLRLRPGFRQFGGQFVPDQGRQGLGQDLGRPLPAGLQRHLRQAVRLPPQHAQLRPGLFRRRRRRRPSTSTPSRPATSRWKATGRGASPRPWPPSTPSRAGRRLRLTGRQQELRRRHRGRQPHLQRQAAVQADLLVQHRHPGPLPRLQRPADRREPGPRVGHPACGRDHAQADDPAQVRRLPAREDRAGRHGAPPASRTKAWISLEYKL